MISNIFKIALLQNKIALNKFRTLEYIQDSLEEAITNGAKICILPECCNSLYRSDTLKANAEEVNGPITNTPTLNLLKNYSRKYEVYIMGSIPEKTKNGKRLYNTGVVFNTAGELIATHRKLHLFDIDIPGKITYKESETFKAGNKLTVFDTQFCKMGLSICYDLRFPELAMLMKVQGAKVLIYPGAFNLTTGPLHWELLLRARAVDTQCYVVGCSPARYEEDTSYYQAWGNSMIVDPMGKILGTTGHEGDVVYGEINLDWVDEVRKQLPYGEQRRTDVYGVVYKK